MVGYFLWDHLTPQIYRIKINPKETNKSTKHQQSQSYHVLSNHPESFENHPQNVSGLQDFCFERNQAPREMTPSSIGVARSLHVRSLLLFGWFELFPRSYHLRSLLGSLRILGWLLHKANQKQVIANPEVLEASELPTSPHPSPSASAAAPAEVCRDGATPSQRAESGGQRLGGAEAAPGDQRIGVERSVVDVKLVFASFCLDILGLL